jgi:hypothetical protein
MGPQRAAALAVSGDVLIDTLVADDHITSPSGLFGTEAFDQLGVHHLPGGLIDTGLHACRVSTLRALSMRLAGGIPLDVCVARYLAADRAGLSLHLLADLMSGPIAAMQRLNLVAFVLAQVRVAHVQFHLAVKLRRLPRLRLFTSSGDALQN